MAPPPSQPAMDARLLGEKRFAGPMPFIIAVMSFIAIIIAAAGFALANAAADTSDALDHSYSVQAPGEAVRAGQVAERIAELPGVVRAAPVGEADMRASLDRWLGPEDMRGDLPLPLLVEVDVTSAANPAAIEAAAKALVPEARLVSNAEALGPVTGLLGRLGWLALALVFLITLATAAAVVLATRGALDTHRATMQVMHGIGATDAQVAGLFQRKIAIDALVGGIAGAIAAAIILALVASTVSSGIAGVGLGLAIHPWQLLLLAAMPIAGALVALGAARFAVLRRLGREP